MIETSPTISIIYHNYSFLFNQMICNYALKAVDREDSGLEK